MNIKEFKKSHNDLDEVSGGIKEELNKLKEVREKRLSSREDSWKKWDNIFKKDD